jgi:hypothetical protein
MAARSRSRCSLRSNLTWWIGPTSVIGSVQLIVVDSGELPVGDVKAAATICRLLIDKGIIPGQPASLMGGDGI